LASLDLPIIFSLKHKASAVFDYCFILVIVFVFDYLLTQSLLYFAEHFAVFYYLQTRLQISPEQLVKKTITHPYTKVFNTFQRVVKEEGYGGFSSKFST
jgi:hypothetical protein